MDKLIRIDNKEVGFRATALTPRLYRHWLSRDIMVDMNKLQKAIMKAEEDELSVVDLEIFENLAWVMAKQYDNTIPDSPEEWLDTFNTFLIYEILPEILDLWSANQLTTASSKKK